MSRRRPTTGGARRTARTLADGRETPPQVESVLNYVATSDLVVALLPNGLGKLGVRDLGGAGHDGFKDAGAVSQVRYVRGGHSAALEEVHWDEIRGSSRTARSRRQPASFSPTSSRAGCGVPGPSPGPSGSLLPFLLTFLAWLLFRIPPHLMRNQWYTDHTYDWPCSRPSRS